MKGWAGKENRSLRQPEAAPGIFLGYQQKWVADESEVKIWEKSRRIGASWSEAGEDALLASRENGMDVFYIGYNKDMALEFIEDAADWARVYNLAAGDIEAYMWEDDADEKKFIQAFRIRFPSGFKVVALSSKPRNLRGKQGKIVIDEAAFHDDLAGLLKAAISMLIWGGRVVIISTHNGEDHPFNELIGACREGKVPYAVHRTTLDDALKDGLYRRVCLRRGKNWTASDEAVWREKLIAFYGEDADEELFCVPAKGGGIYLPGVLVKSCMDADIPVLRFKVRPEFAKKGEGERVQAAADWLSEHVNPLLKKLDETRPCYFGEDFGRTGDLTVIFPLQELPGLIYRAPFIVELRNMPFKQQEQILFHIVDGLPAFRGGALDARGNGQYLAEVAMQKYGEWFIHEVALSQSWYIENMPPFKSAFEEQSILIPQDGDILDDMRAVRMEKGVAKVPDNAHTKGRDGGQRHGDAAIAGALAWYAANKIEGGEWEEDFGQGETLSAGADW
jgi:phage FluMu gp28-like protein